MEGHADAKLLSLSLTKGDLQHKEVEVELGFSTNEDAWRMKITVGMVGFAIKLEIVDLEKSK